MKLSRLSTLLIVMVLTVSFVAALKLFPIVPKVAAYSEYMSLDVSVVPNGDFFKLGVNESQTFSIQVTNGTGPFNYEWYLFPKGNFVLQVNGINSDVLNGSTIKAFGENLTLLFPYATEYDVAVNVFVCDDNGVKGSLLFPFVVSDPYTSSGIEYDGLGYTSDYVVQSDGLGWYRTINCGTGAALYPGTNKTSVLDSTITSLTGGSVVLKEVGWEYTNITIPSNVMVIEQLNGKTRRFINSLNSSGSPYTIGSGDSLYLCQDSANSYINDWASSDGGAVLQDTVDDLGASGGKIHLSCLIDEITTTDITIGNLTSDLILEGEGHRTYAESLAGLQTSKTGIIFNNHVITNTASSWMTGRLIFKDLAMEFRNIDATKPCILLDYVPIVCENVFVREENNTFSARATFTTNGLHGIFAQSDSTPPSGPAGGDCFEVVGNLHLKLNSDNAVGIYVHNEPALDGDLITIGFNGNNEVGILANGVGPVNIRVLEVWLSVNAEGCLVLEAYNSGKRFNIQTVNVASQAGAGSTTPNMLEGMRNADYMTSGNGATDGTTIVCDDLTQAEDYWNSSIVEMMTGTCAGETCIVTDFNATSDTLTLDGAGFSARIDTYDTFMVYFAPLTEINWVYNEVGHVSGNSIIWNATSTAPIYAFEVQFLQNRTLINSLLNSNPVEVWGISTGTGAQQTIPHGLGYTPRVVLLSEYNTGGALPYQSAAADQTNIYVNATSGKTYYWYVKL